MPKPGKNIYLRKDGRWEGRYIKERIDGKIRYGYVFGKTYEEVERKLDAESSEKSISVHGCEDTFAIHANEWLCLKTPQLKASSIAKYKNMLDLYLLPVFGEKQTSVISRAEIVQLSWELLTAGDTKANGLSPKKVNSILSFGTGLMKETSILQIIQNLYISYMQENRGAILLFGKNNSIMSVLAQHKTDAIFRVENKDRYNDRDVVITNLIDSYDRLIEFGQKHLNNLFVLDKIVNVNARDRILRENVAHDKIALVEFIK